MDNNDINTEHIHGSNRGKVIAGIILLVVGVSVLLKQFNYFFLPHWLFGWYDWLILGGIYIGGKNNFRNLSWLVMVTIGIAFLLNEAIPNFDLSGIFWPIALIGFGVLLILRRNTTNKWDKKIGNVNGMQVNTTLITLIL
jgi:uncharacterized membrane protein HdeD (DUF308 family)